MCVFFKIDIFYMPILQINNNISNMSVNTIESTLKRVEELENNMELLISKLQINKNMENAAICITAGEQSENAKKWKWTCKCRV